MPKKDDEFRLFRITRIVSPLLAAVVVAGVRWNSPLLIFLSLIGFIFSWLILVLWECPRCRRLYCTKMCFHWPYVSKCVHCGYEMNGETAA